MFVEELGHGPYFKLRADHADDTVHGAVTIAHRLPPEAHEIYIEVYEVDESPATEIIHGEVFGRRSTLKRPIIMPTEADIQNRLDQMVFSIEEAVLRQLEFEVMRNGVYI